MTDHSSHAPHHAGAEHRDLVEALQAHRGFLRHTLQGLSDEQARARPTVSALSLAAIVKHVAATESSWIDFVLEGPSAMAHTPEQWAAEWQVGPDETPEVLLARYDEVARRTDELVLSGLDLDGSQPLPEAPWFPPNARRSARRVLVHIVAETAQHAGHADIIRESIDGQRTMG